VSEARSAAFSLSNQPGAWRVVPVLIVLQVVSLLDRQVLTLMIGPLQRDLRISDFQVGLLQGIVFGVFYSVAALPIGWAVDRFPRRPIIWLGVTVWSMAASACSLATGFWSLLLARLAVGAGEATLSPASASMMGDLFSPGRLAFAMSVLAIGSSLGNGLAMGLGGVIVDFAEHGGRLDLPGLGALKSWQFAFLITGLPGIVLGLLIFLVREPERHSNLLEIVRPSWSETLRFVSENRRFFSGHFVGFGLLSILGWSFISWVPVYMTRAFGWSIGQIAIPLAVIIGIGGTLGTLLLGVIVDRLFQKGRLDAHFRIYAIVAIIMAVFGVAAFQIRNPQVFLLLIIPIVSTMTLAPTAMAALQIVSPSQMRGQVVALFLLVMNGIGLGVGPTLVGALSDFVFHGDGKLGSSLTLIFAVLAPLAAVVLWTHSPGMRESVRRAAALS
jgi:MFS family permease